MENNTNLELTESMDIINKMISNAKNKLADDGVILIFWGWAISGCALIQYVTIKMNINYGFWAWIIVCPAGGIFSAIYGRKQERKKTVKSYVDTYLKYLWVASVIGMAIALGSLGIHGIRVAYFALMIVYGMTIFIAGGLLDFKPLIWGSFVSFACAIISMFFGDIEKFLIIAIAIIGSYAIPGHLLRSKFKSHQHV
jgi:hypothetical protein